MVQNLTWRGMCGFCWDGVEMVKVSPAGIEPATSP